MSRIVSTALLATLSTIQLAGQTPCDSLIIISVQYSAFSDSFAEVFVENHSSELFDYPGFILFDSNGDTVAKEQVNFFGIGQESLHSLRFVPGQPTAQEFAGHLELWTGFYDTLRCTFNGIYSLCPPDSCVAVYVSVTNLGAAHTYGSASWHLLDSTTELAYGTWTLDSLHQGDTAMVCLPPGHYTLLVDSMSVTGGQPYAQVLTGTWWASTIATNLHPVTGGQIEFDYYITCDSVIQGTNDFTLEPSHILVQSDGEVVTLVSERPLGRIEMFDPFGRRLYSATSQSSEFSIRMPLVSAGIYFVIVTDGFSRHVARVFLNQQAIPHP